MRYYIRKDKNADIQGSFTEQDLVTALRAGEFSSHSLASSDLGESVERLRKWRGCDWFSLSTIPALQHLFPLPPPVATQPRRVTIVRITFLVLLVAIFIDSAITQHRWFYWLLALIALWETVDSMMRYARQRKQHAFKS